MSGQAIVATAGLTGFDTNQPVSTEAAKAFREDGFDFVLRYVPRIVHHAHDLTATEVEGILAAGLAVMAVQHVESESQWPPTSEKGQQYGETAALEAAACGLAQGTTVWCDLEGVDTSTPHENVIAYCRAWFAAVEAGGFQPGLYVGWHCGLTPDQLYHHTPFARFWGAYNLNRDQEPAIRGVCMKQHSGNPPAGVELDIDLDTIDGDALGDFPTLHGP